jgi:predicted small secreted protein
MKPSPHPTTSFRHRAAQEAPSIVAIIAVAGVLALGACHTTAGAGKDISAAGNAITNSAVQNTPN